MLRVASSSDGPELSVIVPCFNEEFNVPEMTRRVLAVFDTGGFRGELILVDDGSSDGTPGGSTKVMGGHPDRVVGKFHPGNRGIAEAWRTGVAAARSPMVAVID